MTIGNCYGCIEVMVQGEVGNGANPFPVIIEQFLTKEETK